MQSLLALVDFSCPENSNGRMVDAADESRGCSVDSRTGLPTNCIFDLYPYKTDKASLMHAEFLPSVSSVLSYLHETAICEYVKQPCLMLVGFTNAE